MSQELNTTTNQGIPGEPQATVPLEELKVEPQWIDCPNCKQTAQTTVKGRGEGMNLFMDVMFWPIRGRRHWFETTHWFCSNCEKELASQKNGKELRVLVAT
ncbi:uncharacterized protein DNG_04070 [Cephalotrichum gorgonifer]|uniref:LITAF domain-containing protein n=1 Tax=Cephalotrichum gorgonifer TaxID=2041049 RepID=A0AAE8MWC4_9PEZI|nr:uncharacterized protein DNG_04070 [Cephalotrichum gorgonifer]